MENTDEKSLETDYFERSSPAILDGIADGLYQNIKFGSNNPEVVVTIPAHNEEKLIQKCLVALADQRTCQDKILIGDRFEILLFCHNCTDATLQKSLAVLSRFPRLNLHVLESDDFRINNVGAVRRILMRIASKRLNSSNTFIAMTDADTIVHPFWVDNIIKYIGSPYHLICGRIKVELHNLPLRTKSILATKESYDNLRSMIIRELVQDDNYPAALHSDNSGPNLAVRANVYDDIGGLEPLGFCEDVAFYDRIIYAGYHVRHCPVTLVTTSGRTVTRVPWGFGAEMGHWEKDGTLCPMVEGISATLQRLNIFSLVLTYPETGEKMGLSDAAHQSGLGQPYLKELAGNYKTVRALVHRLEKDLDALDSWRKKFPLIDIFTANRELEAYVSRTPDRFAQTSMRYLSARSLTT